ncbi:MAG: hypothetical protein ACYDHP_05270 [Ferrimicrobium sp.]
MSVAGVDIPMLPRLDAVEELLAGLFGKEVEAKRLPPGQTVEQIYLCALYRDREERLRALCVLDLPLAGALAGALAWIPPVVIREDVEAGELQGNLHDNVHEVLNICSSLLNDHHNNALHVRLVEVVYGEDLPEEAQTLFDQKANSMNAACEVSGGYGGGRLGIRIT